MLACVQGGSKQYKTGQNARQPPEIFIATFSHLYGRDPATILKIVWQIILVFCNVMDIWILHSVKFSWNAFFSMCHAAESKDRWPNKFCSLEQVLAAVFQRKICIDFGLVWNEMQYSLLIKTDVRYASNRYMMSGLPFASVRLNNPWIPLVKHIINQNSR